MSYRLLIKLISGFNNIITAVMLNYFFMPRTMFIDWVKICFLFFDDFAGPQRLLIIISWHKNGRSHW